VCKIIVFSSLLSIAREETSRLLGVVASPVIELGGAGIAVVCGFLYILQLSTIFQRRGDEGRPHRVRRIPSHYPKVIADFERQIVILSNAEQQLRNSGPLSQKSYEEVTALPIHPWQSSALVLFS
jgi:hypothetical protein